MLAAIQDHIERLAAEDPDFKAKVYLRAETKTCYTGNEIYAERFFPGWYFDRSSEFVQKSFAALQTLGTNPVITTYSFCTNGSRYAGEAGIKTLGFGPSVESLAHTVDEYVLKEQLTKSAEGYVKLIDVLLNLESAT